MAAIELEIDGEKLFARVATGREAVGAHFRIAVRAQGADHEPANLVGKPFTLTLLTRAGDTLAIAGIVTDVSAHYDAGVQHLDLVLGPEAEVLAHGQGSHAWLDKTSVEIAKAVLTRAGVAAAKWPSAAPAKRPYTAQ